MKRLLVGAVALGIVLTAPVALAGPEDLANDISATVMSPFCPGVTLHDCPSQAAVDLRRRIERWAALGWSRDRIVAQLEAEYGPVIHATPPTSGSGLLAWIVPAVAVAAALAVAWVLARRFASRSTIEAEAEATAPIAADDRRRLDAELARFRSSR